jgi:hypothetical protein
MEELEEYFQICQWLDEAKHHHDNLSDFCERFGKVTNFTIFTEFFLELIIKPWARIFGFSYNYE